ncbi:hypothetical protein RISK_004350 [Rhodopirellula islandica]|uniref:Uncharacterized protein n=1 Tax=Rhodopirellula islandica TaxID=595434 RepID=A0A0J1BAQ3_RHOIS|nr:hypothetical protein [Rhodopirellula islandica]KLU03613.1 hypothetical protein RISK_004350 [Rhodopirellula islandica]
MAIEWRPTLKAIALSFVLGMVLGMAFGVSIAIAYLIGGERGTAIYDTPFGMIAGFLVGVVPIVVGARYLVREVATRPYLHCLVFGIANLAISLAFSLLPSETPTSLTDYLYMAGLIPVALITCRMM